MNSTVAKVYLDSRHTVNADSDSVKGDGKTFDLQNAGLVLNPKSRCWLSEFTAVASWDTLDGTNNQLSIQEDGLFRIISLPTGPHDIDSLRDAVEAGLNSSAPVSMGTYTVTKVSTGASGSTYRSFNVSNDGAGQFRILEFSTTNTIQSILDFPTGNDYANSHKSSFIDVRRVHSIYMHVSGMGSYGSFGPRGSRNILAKIPVMVGYGGLVHFQTSGSEHDYFEVGTSALTTLKIELRDVNGNELFLHGTSWSATLLFEQ